MPDDPAAAPAPTAAAVPDPPFAAFTGDYGWAWLVTGDGTPQGFIQPADGGARQTFTDLNAWQAAAEAVGVTAPLTLVAPDDTGTPDAAAGSDAPDPAADPGPDTPADAVDAADGALPDAEDPPPLDDESPVDDPDGMGALFDDAGDPGAVVHAGDRPLTDRDMLR